MSNTPNTPDKPMTARQEEILSAIIEHIRQNYMPPSVRDIGEACGISSPNGVTGHLKALRARGLLVGDPGHKSRNIIPVDLKECIDKHLKAR